MRVPASFISHTPRFLPDPQPASRTFQASGLPARLLAYDVTGGATPAGAANSCKSQRGAPPPCSPEPYSRLSPHMARAPCTRYSCHHVPIKVASNPIYSLQERTVTLDTFPLLACAPHLARLPVFRVLLVIGTS